MASTNPAFRAQIEKHVTKDGVMLPEDVAEAILLAVSLPPRANISEILIRPTSDILGM